MSFCSDYTEQIIKFSDGKKEIVSFFENLVHGIISKKKNPINNKLYLKVYSLVYNLCIQRPPYNYSSKLYVLHNELIKNFILNNLNEDSNLIVIKKNYDYFKIINKWLSRFFSYLDRFYTINESKVKLKQVGRNLYFNIFYKDRKILIINKILLKIKNIRNNIVNDYQIVKDSIILIEEQSTDLKEYIIFESIYLDNTAHYYKEYINNFIINKNIYQLTNKIEEIIRFENDLINNYLNNSSKIKVNSLLDELLIKENLKNLLLNNKEEIYSYFKSENYLKIKNIYIILSRVNNEDGLAILSNYLTELIKKKGDDLISKNDKTNLLEVIDNYLKLYDKFFNFVNDYLSNNMLFNKSIQESFSYIINKKVNDTLSADLLASYFNNFIKKSGKDSFEKISSKINKLIILFSYLNDKDLFNNVYTSLLSKRLLKNNCTSDIEKTIILKLKLECGSQYTSKIEGMCNDLEIGKNCYPEVNNELSKSVYYSTNILTLGFWKNNINISLNLPNELIKYKDLYNKHYGKENKMRKLSWAYSLSNNDMIMFIKTKKYYFSINTLQASLLMLYNDCDSINFNDIMYKLNLIDNKNKNNSKTILKKLLHPLVFSKYKILKKNKKTNNIDEDDEYSINYNFKSKTNRFKIPIPSLEVKTKKDPNIDLNRKFSLEASIVRIMKTRKEMNHNDLISEVFKHISLFKPQVKQIKKSIESLLEKEYIERSSNKPNTYTYMA